MTVSPMNPSQGYIGLTDPDWYHFLSAQHEVQEVNFWQPHGNRAFRVLQPGEPFFFKLRAPLRAIAGFGFFQRFEILPVWLAWECFGQMNGAPDYDSLLDRLRRLRNDSIASDDSFNIGCIMITAPMFFRQMEWVAPPADWPLTGVQQGKRYSVEAGEGARVFRECMEQAARSAHSWNVERMTAEEGARYGTPMLVKPRLGQGLFTLAVRDAYQGACAVTQEHSSPVLEAAHIVPYSKGGLHSVDNGLLLRSDLHRLYDRGYVTVTPDYRFKVSERLREEFRNGRSYYALSGSSIALPAREEFHPRREHLEWHQAHCYKG